MLRVASLLLLAAASCGFVAPVGRSLSLPAAPLAADASRSGKPAPLACPPHKMLRGGSTVALVGLPAAAGIAAAAGTLAYIRQAYIFSLSYGLSMLGIGAAVLLASPASTLLALHAGLVAAYGLRLFAFLFWRQKLQPGYDGAARLRALDKTPRLQRTPVILSTALFYALMASPLLYHATAAPLVGVAGALSAGGSAIAAVGLVVEAVADQQKSLFKMSLRAAGRPDELYVGGLYASSRHANYFGEMVFWAGSFVAGLPAVVSGAVPLYVRLLRGIASGLGLAGIFFIMLSATKRLEGRQAEKYRPSAAYDKYYLSTNALLPRLANLY